MPSNQSAQSTDVEQYPLLMSEEAYMAYVYALVLICFHGCGLWSPLNIILFNLVCTDFSVAILGNPLTLVSALFRRWVFGRTMCKFYGFFMALLSINSITSLAVISFERYLMVTRPLRSRHLTSRGALASLVFICGYSLALTVPPLLGWGNYTNAAANIGCSVNWHEQSTNALTYILFLFAMGQIVPIIVISFFYANIIYFLNKRPAHVSKDEVRETAVVFLMTVTFILTCIPYSIVALIEHFGPQNAISPGASVTAAMVAKSSICLMPCFYFSEDMQFWDWIIRVIYIPNPRPTATAALAERCSNHTAPSPEPPLLSIRVVAGPSFNHNRKVRIADEKMIPTRSIKIYRPLPIKIDLSPIKDNGSNTD